MGDLREKMLMVMQMKNFSKHTIDSYLSNMKCFVKYFNIPPEELSYQEICKYLYYLKNHRRLSWQTIRNAYSAIKFFYTSILFREWDNKQVPYPKPETKLPVVLSRQEVKNIIDAAENIKHKTILMTIYSAGLRLSEARNLEITDIDSKLMQIHIRKGKCKKERYTLLSAVLLNQLRKYYRKYKPKAWLFPGQKPNSPLCSMTIQRFFINAKKKLKLINLPLFTPSVIPLQVTF